MADDLDHYEVLGIAATATDGEVRAAWRKLALRWHPDRAGQDTTRIFQRVLDAYTVLSDPMTRAAYDRGRTGAKTGAKPVDEQPLRRAPGTMIRRVSAPLESLLARGIARECDDGVVELSFEPAELAEGGMVVIAMDVAVRCAACASDPARPCAPCGSTRAIVDRFSAWLAVRPGVAEGTILVPSAQLPRVIRPVAFRVRVAA